MAAKDLEVKGLAENQVQSIPDQKYGSVNYKTQGLNVQYVGEESAFEKLVMNQLTETEFRTEYETSDKHVKDNLEYDNLNSTLSKYLRFCQLILDSNAYVCKYS